MSQYFSLIFFWSKGSLVRRRILIIIADAQETHQPIFVSEIARLYNETMEKKKEIHRILTNSAIRKHIQFLIKYGIVIPINKGGRPEYLELTLDGIEAVKRIRQDNARSKIHN